LKRTLIWNNKKAEDMEVKIISIPPIQLSTERVEEKEVEGRDGTLTETDGYTTDTKQVECDFRGADTQRILQWLKGNGEVIFGNIDDRYYKARINNAVPLNQVIENQLYSFSIQFRCQPFGYLLDGNNIKALTTATTLKHNKCTYKSLPLITICGTGACTVTINGRTFNISEIGGSITIDSDIELVLNGKGNYMSGLFPYLDPGENNISWTGTGVTRLDIVPHWRAL